MARARPVVPLTQSARLTVPVLSGVGGSGRSVVAGVLAASLNRLSPAVVLDSCAAPGPWRAWSHGGAGLDAIPANASLLPRQVVAAASELAIGGRSARVLTDRRVWSAQPLRLPFQAQAWAQLAALGGWPVAVIDTDFSVVSDLVAARWSGAATRTGEWWQQPGCVPVVVATASGDGLEGAALVLSALADARLDPGRAVLVVVDHTGGRLPRQVKAALTMLHSRAGALVHLPFDSGVRAHGLRGAADLASETLRAADGLADAVVLRAEHYFGPLRAVVLPAPAALNALEAPDAATR